MTTVHALIMVFGAVMPATVGLANWMIPLQIGAPDMALPRMGAPLPAPMASTRPRRGPAASTPSK